MAKRELNERGLQIGEILDLTWRAAPEHGIALGIQGQVTVFSTPSMINLMEHAAKNLLRRHLEDHEESVGAVVNVEHLAPTVLGEEVTARAEVIGIERNSVEFQISAWTAKGEIGRGTHRRGVIDVNKFAARIAESATTTIAPVGVLPPVSAIVPDNGPMPVFDDLRVSVKGALAEVILSRPRARNAIRPETVRDFEKLFAWLAGHADSVRVVILTGDGETFCAGSDVRTVADAGNVKEVNDFSIAQGRLAIQIGEVPQVFLAAVNGHCFGGGMTLAAACDFRIAATSAQFGMPEIKLGWPGGWGMKRLYDLLGAARTSELCLSGRTITAAIAEDWGFLLARVPQARLLTEARRIAGEWLVQAPLALRENKWLMRDLAGAFARNAYPMENAAYIRCYETVDAKEGIRSFLEKRSPKWTGR